nr:Uncharacterised protein [Klebsiella pneumoniae]
MINGNYALEAGLAKDALGLESAEHNPYANILVTTPARRMTRALRRWRKI